MKEKPENLEFVKAFVKEMKQSMTVFKKRGISAFPSALPPKSPVSEPFIFSCAREEASSTSSKKRYVRGMIREIYIREIYSRLQQTISTSIAPTIDIDRFKKLIEDIIEFFISVEHAVAESAEFGSCSSKRSCKPKKKEYCDGKETGHSIAKLEEDFIDTLRKFKLSFNLLAELKAQIIDSFSTDVIDFLFTYLELIIDASRDAELETNIPKRIVLPPLTVKAAKLLSNCLTSKQAEFWKSLGKAWQAPSWYFGRLSNQDVIDVLRSIGQDGAFLVRDSRSVSFGYVLCVRKENRVFQYRINKVHGYEIGGLTFSDLPAVISYYKKTQSLDTKLRKPPFDFDGLRRTEKNVAKSDLISSTSGEGIKDLTKALKDKFKGKFKNKSKKNKRKNYFQKHQKLGYLPVQLENYSANQNTAGDSTTSLQFTPSMSNLETPQSTRVGEDVHARQELYASRLAQLIAAIDQIHKEELESMIRKLEEETASLQAEYEILRGHQSPSLSLSSTSDANQSLNRIVLTTYIEREMLAEAQILRQPKARLEARMNILKEDNKQLRAQLARLRKPLDKSNLETPQSTRVGEDVHARQELYASRLAQLIAAIDQIHKEELESMIRKLEEETASLQAEYEILRGHQSPSLSLSSTSDANQSLNTIVLNTYIEREMLAEAQILRQPKARLEARMNILKEDNKQLRAQLARLLKPLDKMKLKDGTDVLLDDYYWMEVPGFTESEPENSLDHSLPYKPPSRVRSSNAPIQVYSTFVAADYDRRNDDVDPIAASAEYEMEERVEKMDLFEVQLNKGLRALAEAIQEATAMNPDMTVEKTEIQQQDSEYVLLQERETSYFQDSEYVLLQERETECIQFEENFDGFLSRRFDKREGTEITDTIESMHLNNYALVHDGLNLQPRGLLNKGNYCYINAVLQGLMGCPPFYNMIRAIEPIVKMKDTSAKPTPVMETLVSFVNEFVTLPPPISPNPKAKESMKPSTKISHGLPFEPSMVYSLMQTFNAFKEIGRQEDAEELLTVLLNALNDEMIELVKPVSKLVQNSIDKPIENGNVEEPEEWHVIGPTNKGTLTRLATICRTPVGDLFLGQMRSVLRTEKGMCTATLQPFLTLQLDIQNEKVNTVNEALDMLVVKEPLVGYIDPKSKKEIRASRQTTLEALPPILMLHLKYFLYDKHGGCQKLMKRIDFPLELEITRDVLSSNIKAKMSNKQRNYKLFAVIYHDGKEATKGHYVADVYHPGLQRWIRYDDAAIKMVDEKTLLRHSPPRVPYLLFYKTKEF